jgi:hypothetical protein
MFCPENLKLYKVHEGIYRKNLNGLIYYVVLSVIAIMKFFILSTILYYRA